MRSKKGNIPPLLRRYHHLSFPSYPNQRKVEVSFNSIPPLRAPGHYQKLNSAKVSHPSRCLSTLCQALLRTILRTLLGISWMLHLPHPPLSPSFHVPRHHRDNPFRPFANSIQSQPNASAHQNFKYAPCAQPLLLLPLLPGYGRAGAVAAHHARTHRLTSPSLTPTILHLLQGTGSSSSHRPRPIYLPPLGHLFLQVHVLLVQTSPHPHRRKTQYPCLPFQPFYPISSSWGPR